MCIRDRSTDSDLASDPLFLARGMHETRGHLRVNFLAADGACAEEDDATPAPTPDDGALEPQSKKKSSSSSGPDTALVAGVVVAASVALIALGVAGAYLFRRRGAARPDDLAVKGESIEIEEESKEQPATD